MMGRSRWVPIALALVVTCTLLLHLQTDSPLHYANLAHAVTPSPADPATGASVAATAGSDTSYSDADYENENALGYGNATVLDLLVQTPPDPLAWGKDRSHGDQWRDVYTTWNNYKLADLAVCNALQTCHPNANKIVLFMSTWCLQAKFEAWHGGEGLWCDAMMKSLDRQGYTVLLAANMHSEAYVWKLYQQMPDMIRLIVNDEGFGPFERSLDHRPFHIKSGDHPDGITAWKVFNLRYFGESQGAKVGEQWAISAEPHWLPPDDKLFINFTFIGFELEKGKNVKPAADRPNRVWVYGKRSDYFDMGDSRFSWPEEWFARAHDDLSKEYPGFEFVGAIKEVKVEANPVNKYLVDKWQGHETVPAPAGIRNLGSTLPKDEFEREMGLSRAMLGVGWPRTSPSPYYALANGVPFINPHRKPTDGRRDPDDPLAWQVTEIQHSTMRFDKEPYVYNVEADGDYEVFVNAIRRALDTPIEPFVHDFHTAEALDKRVREWVETDWREVAKPIYEARQSGNETQQGNSLGPFVL